MESMLAPRGEEKALASREAGCAIPAEAAALEWARGFFRRLRDSDGNPDPSAAAWTKISPLAPSAGSMFMRHLIELMLRHGGANGRLNVCAMARAGVLEAQEVLGAVIAGAGSRLMDLPTELIAYNSDLATGRIRRAPRGPKPKDRFLRNLSLALMVWGLVDRFGVASTYRKTRSGKRSARRPASVIVAEAYSLEVAQIGYKGVEAAIAKVPEGAIPKISGWTTIMWG
jgi:hypothetical protein